jgi:hypothetical protein
MNDNDKTPPNAAGPIILFTLLFGISYAVVCDHVAWPVPGKGFPFFVLKKGLSLAAFIPLGASEGAQIVVRTTTNTPVARNEY